MSATKADALRRLDRVAGQARAVRNMVEEDRSRADILAQIHALKGALDAVEVLILTEHIDALYALRVDEVTEGACPVDRLKTLHDTLRHHVGGR